ncbi:COMM domain-containing protein 7-like [Ornithodoros turicata]|uniref:COMM domain-containing protein 7-like n=1 Tax=Ornithodoros turicata TaxID=34597 RepID=UPI00313906B4
MDSSVDIGTLNQLSETLFQDLLKMCLQFLQLQQQEDSNANAWLRQTLEAYANKHANNMAQLKTSCKAILTLVEEVQSRKPSSSQLSTDLSSLGLDAPKTEAFVEIFNRQKGSQQPLLSNQLVNAQWQFGVTVASSGEAAKRAFVQLRLSIRRPDGSLGDVHCEMSAPQFFSFCHEMEQAKVAMQSLHS